MRALFEQETAISPVVGAVLLVGITLLLAVTAAGVFLGIDEGTGHRSPQTVFEFSYTPDPSGADALEIRHGGGDTLTAGDTFLVVEGATPTAANGEYRFDAFGIYGTDDPVSAGQSVTVDGSAVLPAPTLDLRGATVRVVWDAPNREVTVKLSEWRGPGV